MPPVLGPVSPSPSRLWSWAAGSRSSCAPSVRANTDSSSPFKKSSMTISRPASPNAASASIARAARAASVRRAHTTAPFPAARPDAFTTSGSAWRLMYARAGSSAVKVWLAAVAIRARRITSFANALDDSMRAAAALGPNTACPASRRASASPAASGPSGPTMVKSIWCSRAAATRSAVAPAESGRLVPSWRCRGCREPRRLPRRGSRASAPSRVRARGRPPRRPGLSRLLVERVRERLGGPLGGVHHVVHDGLRFLHVVVAGVVDVLVDRSLLCLGPAAGVFAAQHAIVVTLLDPALQLGGPQGVEGVRLGPGIDDFEHAVQCPPRFLILLRLLEERVEIHLLHVAAARHFQEHPHRSGRILSREKARTIGRELALPIPLEQRELDGSEDDPRQEREEVHPDEHDEHEDGVVQRVTAHHVPDLVTEQDAHLVVVEQVQRAGVDHDERPVHPVGSRIHERGLRHEQLGPLRPVEGREHIGVESVHSRELRRPNADRVGLEQQPDAAFAQEADDLLYDLVEARNGAERLQCGAVGGVLPRHGRDLGEDLAWARGRQGGLSHMMLLTGIDPHYDSSRTSGFARGQPAAASACSKSAIKSSTSSIPTDSRTRLSVSPIARRISGGTLAWVIDAGCPTRLSTPPSDSASAKMRVCSANRLARSTDPSSIEIMPPNPFICRQASSCWRWDGSPG